MAAYSNYQLPSNMYNNGMYNSQYPQPAPVSPPQAQYSNSAPPQYASSAPSSSQPQQPYYASNELVPSYGPPLTQQQLSVAPAPSSSSGLSPEEQAIIASQERAWEVAKSGRRSPVPSSSARRQVVPYVEEGTSSRQMVPHDPNSGSLTAHVPGVKVDHKNRPVSDAIHPGKYKMKKQRKMKTASGVAGGALVGTLVAGPVGTVLGGAAGGYAANKISKNGERRAQRKHEQASYQAAASKSGLAEHAAFA